MELDAWMDSQPGWTSRLNGWILDAINTRQTQLQPQQRLLTNERKYQDVSIRDSQWNASYEQSNGILWQLIELPPTNIKAKDALKKSAQESRRYNNILSVMKIMYLTLLATQRLITHPGFKHQTKAKFCAFLHLTVLRCSHLNCHLNCHQWFKPFFWTLLNQDAFICLRYNQHKFMSLR